HQAGGPDRQIGRRPAAGQRRGGQDGRQQRRRRLLRRCRRSAHRPRRRWGFFRSRGISRRRFLFASMNLVNLRRAIAAAGVILTLLLACASVDVQKLRTLGEDGDDVGSTLDDETALAATSAVPALIPPPWG